MRIYGIPNCDTVQKAIKWLKENKINFEFHDFKKSGITEIKLKEWTKQVGWEALINKKGTTWRALDPNLQNSITSEQPALALMQEKTSVIKRPVLEAGKKILLGFDEAVYKNYFSG